MADSNTTFKVIDYDGMGIYTEEVKKLIRKMVSESSEFEIVTESTYLDFPVIGNAQHLYIDSGANRTYRWNDDDLHYYCIGADYDNIKLVDSSFD